MAEITTEQTSHRKKPGCRRSKKLSTRVDLTPMVDLGFLLITFFIFTTSLSQPAAMKVIMPDDKGEHMPTKQSGALTIIINGNSKVHYFEGNLYEDASNLYAANLSQLRDAIIRKKRTAGVKDMFVVIKPTQECVFKDVVNVLDEMLTNDVRKYAIVDISAEEQQLASRTSGPAIVQ